MELQLDRLCHYSHRKRATQKTPGSDCPRSKPGRLIFLEFIAFGANGRVIASELRGPSCVAAIRPKSMDGRIAECRTYP